MTANNSLQRTGGLQWSHRARRGTVARAGAERASWPAADLDR
jgi:hypothetical protein